MLGRVFVLLAGLAGLPATVARPWQVFGRTGGKFSDGRTVRRKIFGRTDGKFSNFRTDGRTGFFEGVCLVLRASSGKHARFVGVGAAGGDSVSADSIRGRVPNSVVFYRETVFQPPPS